MAESEGWRSGTARGVIGGLLAMGLGSVALRNKTTPSLMGIGVGFVAAFAVAYLVATVERGLVPRGWPVRFAALVLLPPIGSLLALGMGKDFAVGFTFSSGATYLFCYGLLAMRTGEGVKAIP
ncbi:MAG TPA: hypothetical protein VGQ17_08815 [Gemmatimonadales bacterium]|jgi:predicted PurR-regulated permease PerM|nr:hypothetical protein [Gemmatimonadales bacterium]